MKWISITLLIIQQTAASAGEFVPQPLRKSAPLFEATGIYAERPKEVKPEKSEHEKLLEEELQEAQEGIANLRRMIETLQLKPIPEAPVKVEDPHCEDCDKDHKKTAVKSTPMVKSTHTVIGHSHKCPRCGTVWSHAPGKTAVSHNCPRCGTAQYVVHQEGVAISVETQKPQTTSTQTVQAFHPSVQVQSGCANGQCSLGGGLFGRRAKRHGR